MKPPADSASQIFGGDGGEADRRIVYRLSEQSDLGEKQIGGAPRLCFRILIEDDVGSAVLDAGLCELGKLMPYEEYLATLFPREIFEQTGIGSSRIVEARQVRPLSQRL